MRVLVCGSRSWTDIAAVRQRLSRLPAGTVVIHGAARGADSIASAAAYMLGFEVEAYPANWEQHGKQAGFIRNDLMLNTRPDLVIVFWDGVSRGTLHTIMGAAQRGIPTETIIPDV